MNFPSSTSDHHSCGASWLGGRFRVDFAAEIALKEPVDVDLLPRNIEPPAVMGGGVHDLIQNFRLLAFADWSPVLPARDAAGVGHQVGIVLQQPLTAGLQGPIIPAQARPEPMTGTVRSANLGVLGAVQLHDVGGVAALRLRDVGVLAAVRQHDAEAAPGCQLAQVPHPAYASERDS